MPIRRDQKLEVVAPLSGGQPRVDCLISHPASWSCSFKLCVISYKLRCVWSCSISGQLLGALQANSEAPIHQSTLKNSYSPRAAIQQCSEQVESLKGKRLAISTPQNDLCPDFYQEAFPPPCKDNFPWLHLTTGTILSIGSLIQSDWIHCSPNPDGCSLKFSFSQLPPQSSLQSWGLNFLPRMQHNCLRKVR